MEVLPLLNKELRARFTRRFRYPKEARRRRMYILAMLRLVSEHKGRLTAWAQREARRAQPPEPAPSLADFEAAEGARQSPSGAAL